MIEHAPVWVDQSWKAEANCHDADPELFFPPRGGSTEPAKEFCRGCDVRQQCLDYSFAINENFGVWGGVSQFERLKIRRAKRQQDRPRGTALLQLVE